MGTHLRALSESYPIYFKYFTDLPTLFFSDVNTARKQTFFFNASTVVLRDFEW